MRELKSSDKNVLEIFDARSNTDMELYYRTPTTREEALYQAKLVKKKGRKVVIAQHKTRVEFGLRMITGFKEGNFGEDGEPFSADPESPNYREDWKECLERGASDILAILGSTIFEGARPDVEVDVDELLDEELDNKDEVLEEASPLGTSSEDS